MLTQSSCFYRDGNLVLVYSLIKVFLLCSSIHPAPSDYPPGPYSVTFPVGSTTAAVNITIESDNVFEGTENFTATISTANTGFPSVTAGDDDVAIVDIQEDACVYHLHVHAINL